jgi:hypothetical protein
MMSSEAGVPHVNPEASHPRRDVPYDRADVRSAFVPMLILAVSFAALVLHQAFHLVRERELLANVQTTQQRQVDESKKLRERLQSLARDMQSLANRGNAGASLVVEELRRRGVTISADAPPAATPSAPAPSSGVPSTPPAK